MGEQTRPRRGPFAHSCPGCGSFNECECELEPRPSIPRPVATTYLLNPGAYPSDWVTVQLTCFAGEGPHKPPHDTWAVRRRGECLTTEGEWEHEPLPSSRDDEFYARARYALEDAITAGQKALGLR